MKQPELGRKISELRIAKGLTQEELVVKCNISVRTIQRIESGEVTPRSYTVKTILAALEHDLAAISDQDSRPSTPVSNGLRRLMLIDIDINKPSDFLIRQLNIAWVFGIVYFILGFLESAAEYFRFRDDELPFGDAAYVVLKALAMISFIFFQRGFIMIGGLFNNYLLKIVSMMLIGADIVVIGYDIVSLFYDSFERVFVLSAASLSFGVIGIIYGISLRRLERPLGRVAELAGIFEIAAACFFVTVFLSFIGFIVQTPAVLFEIIIIFKTIDIVRTKQVENSLAVDG